MQLPFDFYSEVVWMQLGPSLQGDCLKHGVQLRGELCSRFLFWPLSRFFENNGIGSLLRDPFFLQKFYLRRCGFQTPLGCPSHPSYISGLTYCLYFARKARGCILLRIEASIPSQMASPPPGLLKLNSDGSGRGNPGHIEGVIQNSEGEIILFFSSPTGFCSMTSVNNAGLREPIHLDLRHVLVEGDFAQGFLDASQCDRGSD